MIVGVTTIGAATRANRRSGFTLLELVVAAAMFAIVVSAVVTTFFAAADLRESNQDALARVQQLHQALTVMKRDLRSATIPTTNIVSAGLVFTSGDDAEETGVTLSGEMITGNGVGVSQAGDFQFSTASGVMTSEQIWGPVQRVRYYLRTPVGGGVTNGMELVRGITRNVLSDTQQPDYAEQLLLRGVANLGFAFWNGAEWLDYWDSTTLDPFTPEAIRVDIEMLSESSSSAVELVELVIPLYLKPLTNALEELVVAGGQGGAG